MSHIVFDVKWILHERQDLSQEDTQLNCQRVQHTGVWFQGNVYELRFYEWTRYSGLRRWKPLPERTMKREDLVSSRTGVRQAAGSGYEIYLNTDIRKSEVCWVMSSKTYVKNAVAAIEALLAEDGRELQRTQQRGTVPLSMTYIPKLKKTVLLLDEALTSRYLQMFGILQCVVECGTD
jgi:hypothetical protein